MLKNTELKKLKEEFSAFLKKNKSCKSVFNDVIDSAYISDVANAKRFNERFIADSEFRELFHDNPKNALKKYNQNIAVDDALYMCDSDYKKQVDKS